MNIARRTVSALKWSAGGRIVSQALTWAMTLVVIRLLDPADYGLMAMVSVVMTIGAYLADFGLSQALVQAPHLDGDLRARLAALVIALHVTLAALVVLASPLVAAAFAEPRLGALVRVAALQYLFVALGSVQHALAMRALDFKWLARIEVGCATAAGAVTLLLAWHGAGVWSLVLGGLAGAAVRGTWLLARGERVRPHFDFRGLRERTGYGARLAASQMSWLLVSQSDVLIGARLMSRASLGAYSVGLHLATLPMQKLMSVVNQVGFSALARLQTEPEHMRQRLLQAVRLLAAVAVPVLWGLSSVAQDLVAVVLGDKWDIAAVPLQLASLVVPFRMVAALFNTAVAAIGRAGTDLRNTIMAAVAWPASFAVGAHWGANGLAAAWLAAIPLTFMVNFPRTSRALGISFGSVARSLRAPACAGVLMYAVVAAIGWSAPDLSAWPRLALMVGSGAATYLAAITLFDRHIWRDLRRIVSPSREGA